ncbi:hypothetical protein [Candidatus Igneacidithiobacillus taiwanensis]|uniref:hypothetical protein n=1 Tax=Candidatus Igneacidithiobacillus taiwanensis TaxID=1945924 RepID=UPI00289B3767|nr:hypothetical protein [Candidatus Igneacidithiobacillus taiwanensis]
MTAKKQTKKQRPAAEQLALDHTWSAPKPRGRPRVHEDRKAAQRAASAAYRERRRARREAPEIEDRGIIDLSAVPAYRVRKR